MALVVADIAVGVVFAVAVAVAVTAAIADGFVTSVGFVVIAVAVALVAVDVVIAAAVINVGGYETVLFAANVMAPAGTVVKYLVFCIDQAGRRTRDLLGFVYLLSSRLRPTGHCVPCNLL